MLLVLTTQESFEDDSCFDKTSDVEVFPHVVVSWPEIPTDPACGQGSRCPADCDVGMLEDFWGDKIGYYRYNYMSYGQYSWLITINRG